MRATNGLRIRVDQALPSRPRTLMPDELSGVFGGCNTAGVECGDAKSCCSGNCSGGLDAVQSDGSVKTVRPNKCQ